MSDEMPQAADILEGSSIAVMICDSSFRVRWVNGAFERYFDIDRGVAIGTDRRQLIEETIQKIVDQPEDFAARLLSSCEDNASIESLQCHVVGNGERPERWLEHWCQPIESGSWTGGSAEFYTDVSEARGQQADLAEANRELNRIVASVSDYLWSSDIHGDGRVDHRYFSPVMESVTGYPPSYYKSGPARGVETIHPEDRPRINKTIGELIGRRRSSSVEEFRITRPDGSVRWLRESVRATPLTDGGIRLDGVTTDITDRKWAEIERTRLEDKIRQTQKLEGLGVLAGGLAHDFNNLLTGILGNAGLALRDVPPGSPVHGALKRVEAASLRAAELTNQMLAYSGQGQFVTVALDLSQLVKEMAQLLEASISKKAQLVVELASDLTTIQADPSQLRQIVMNLIINASDALESGPGVIRISTRRSVLSRSDLDEMMLGHTLPQGPYVSFEVIDTGCGMDADTCGKIFDPFFTTKFTGRGLGLAAAAGIVRSHSGAISLRSAPGKGTTFQIWLPTGESVAEPLLDLCEQPTPKSGEGLILVVDDEPLVRELVRLTLEELGFEVMEARDGEEALELVAQHAGRLRLLVLDLTMPRLGGDEVLRAIRQSHPGLPVILSSGYGREGTALQSGDLRPDGFLPKPYDPAALAATVNEVLDTVAARAYAGMPKNSM